MPSVGCLYVALGDAYVAEAARSAASLRAVQPNIDLTLVCDRDPVAGHLFSHVVRDDRPFDGKAGALLRTVEVMADGLPYDRTIFLDTDTYVLANLWPLFPLLDHCDVAMALAPNGLVEGAPEVNGEPVRAAEIYNTGVIALARNDAVAAMLADWRDRFAARIAAGLGGWETDQRSFSEAVLAGQCRMQALSAAWNFRTSFYVSVVGEVRVLHGRDEDLQSLGERLNESHRNRAWDPHTRTVSVFDPTRVVRS
jgi:hypothetical protein